MIPKPEVGFCQKARELCEIPLTATKGHEEGKGGGRDRDSSYCRGWKMPENQSFGPAGRFIVTGMQISDEGRIMNKAPVRSSQ